MKLFDLKSWDTVLIQLFYQIAGILRLFLNLTRTCLFNKSNLYNALRTLLSEVRFARSYSGIYGYLLPSFAQEVTLLFAIKRIAHLVYEQHSFFMYMYITSRPDLHQIYLRARGPVVKTPTHSSRPSTP